MRFSVQAELAFSVVQSRYISICDNFALLLLDCVWTLMLQQLGAHHTQASA